MKDLRELKTPDDIEAFALEWLDALLGFKLGLREDDSEYDLVFLGQKLAQCAWATEQVSDALFQLSRVSIEVVKAETAAHRVWESKVRELKASPDYQSQDRDQKTPFLQARCLEQEERALRWTGVKKLVSEVKDAVGQRGQDLKRLDSDLRLTARLLEAKLASGAAGKGTPQRGAKAPGGAQEGELDIN